MVAHWAWSNNGYVPEANEGWLFTLDFHDFAGSGVVHVLGGVSALAACAIVGPRKGRFTEDGSVIPIPGHSIPIAAMGGFILLLAFLAFNGGAQVKYTALPPGLKTLKGTWLKSYFRIYIYFIVHIYVMILSYSMLFYSTPLHSQAMPG